jgi:hypothetical protein
LQGCVKIYQKISATDEVKLGKRRVCSEVLNSVDDHFADFFGCFVSSGLVAAVVVVSLVTGNIMG